MRTQEYILIIVRITCQTDKEDQTILYTAVNQVYKLTSRFFVVNRKCKLFKTWLLSSLHFYNTTYRNYKTVLFIYYMDIYNYQEFVLDIFSGPVLILNINFF